MGFGIYGSTLMLRYAALMTDGGDVLSKVSMIVLVLSTVPFLMMEITLAEVTPCSWSSLHSSSSSNFASWRHLITPLLEFSVLCGDTETGMLRNLSRLEKFSI